MGLMSLGFRTDVALRAAEGAEVTDRGDGLVIRTPDNPGFWWGNFLLLAAWPREGDGWLARYAAEFPQAKHVAIGVDVTAPAGRAPAEFATLEPEYSTVLTCTDIHAPRHVSTEAEIRPLESGRDWRQSVDLNLRCYGEEEPTDYQRRRVAARRRLTRAGRAAWFGAFGGGRLLAQLGVCDAGSGLARYQDVETAPRPAAGAWPGRWSGTRAGSPARGSARETLVIVADPADGAIRVYRDCGFADVQTQVSFARAAT